jgi:hypothetical protein
MNNEETEVRSMWSYLETGEASLHVASFKVFSVVAAEDSVLMDYDAASVCNW